MERGERETVSNPWPRRILAIFGALFFGFLGYVGAFGVLSLNQVGAHLGTGESWLDFDYDLVRVLSDWRLKAAAIVATLLSGLIFYERLMANWRSENSMADTTDINPHKNDQHVTLIEELQRELDWFPDTGAHAPIEMTSLLSHVMLSNKGLKTVEVAKRHKKDGVDHNGEMVYKGQEVRDENGKIVMVKRPLIDEKFGQELMTASGLPLEAKQFRQGYDVRKIPYNPPAPGQEKKAREAKRSGKGLDKIQRVSRDKGPHDTVSEFINKEWEIPEYEVQRPAGAYLVDTAPANTMV